MDITENEYVVSLITLNQGAAVELFDTELRKLIANIADLQTEATVTRTIQLTVKVKPVESRKEAAVELSIVSKQAPQKHARSSVWFGKVEGVVVAVQTDPNQGRLFDKPHTGNVQDFKKEHGA